MILHEDQHLRVEAHQGLVTILDKATTYARLFVASPRLLAALKDMVKWHGRRASVNDELLPAVLQAPEVAEAMLAIKEAEGRS